MSTASGTTHASYLRDVSHNKGHLLIDRDGIPSYDGEPEYVDDFEERAKSAYFSMKTYDRRLLPQKIKNQLFGRAHLLTHKNKTIAAEALDEAWDEEEPMSVLRLLLKTVREAVVEEKDIYRGKRFDDYFKRGRRRAVEPIKEYDARRREDYDKLVEVSPETSISEDLRCYFFMELSGLNEKEKLNILQMTNNEYDHKRVLAAMLVQHHSLRGVPSDHPNKPSLLQNQLRSRPLSP